METQVASYRHERARAEQLPDDQPGDYFVSARDGERWALVSGPYVHDHAAALQDVRECRRLVEEVDPRAAFYAFGTCRFPAGSGKIGFLQQHNLRRIIAAANSQPDS